MNNKLDHQDEKLYIMTSMIYLIMCALNSIRPRPEVVSARVGTLRKLAQYHTISVLMYQSVKQLAEDLDEEDQKELALWKRESDMAIRKTLLQDTEKMELFYYLDQIGCWYMPLKGSVIKDLYPVPWMRQMADIDVLFDPSCRESIKHWFESRQYRVESYEKSNHDVYLKEPVYNFEMHSSLYGDSHDSRWKAYYADIKDRLAPSESDDSKGQMRFTEEDFYVYFASHGYKHFSQAGNGLRSLCDFYILTKHMENRPVNWAYIETEAKKLGVDQYEAESRELAGKIFSPDIKEQWENLLQGKESFETFLHSMHLSEDEWNMIAYLFGSGTYGNVSNYVNNRLHGLGKDGEISKKIKMKYILHQLVPDQKYYKVAYPFLYKYKFLQTAFVIYRLFRGGLKRGRAILQELKLVIKA